jgi:phosphatidylserine decarboxylase
VSAWRPLSEGAPLLAGCAVVTALGAHYFPPAALLGVAGAGAIAFAFRDPERDVVPRPDVALSPADGRVLHIATVRDDFWNVEMLEIGVFLALWNVHVQRAPLDGTVVAQRRKPGGYAPAMTPEATHGNHQLATYLETAAGPCTVTQISGLVARRLVSWTAEGATLRQGERFGMIKFGSQVTLRLPSTATPLVEVGQQVRAGLTPLARVGTVAG